MDASTISWISVSSVLAALILIFIAVVFFCSRSIRPKPKSVEDRHAIVTGGSSGLGLAMAKYLLLRGAKVTLLARNEARLLSAKDECVQTTGVDENCINTVSVDAGKSAKRTREAINTACAHFGPVYMLINCAGMCIPEVMETMSDDTFEKTIEANVLTAAHCTKAVLPIMIEANDGGHIVMVSSQGGQIGLYGFCAYATAKFGLKGFAEALQAEVAHQGILVSIMFPPDMDTPGFAAENLIKTEKTKAMSEAGGLLSADDAAKTLMSQALAGRFACVTLWPGLPLWLATAGMAPPDGFWRLLAETTLAGVVRLVSLLDVRNFYAIASR